MKRIATGKNGHRIRSGSSDVWSTVPWLTAHRIGAQHGYRIDGAEQHVSAYASQNEHAVAGIVAGAMQEQRKEETKQQGAALNAWEDEGGK